MVKEKTVKAWNFSNLGYEINEAGDVTKIFCKICREHYENSSSTKDVHGKVLGQVDKFIKVGLSFLV